ncbi:MAG: hypothetical protein OHK0037_27700 [Elainellaceae cyanobacterium]
MMTKERYLEILDANLSLDPLAWFTDAPADGEDDFQYSGDAAIALIEQGETFWDCPGWVADVARELLQIRLGDDLARLRAIAQKLLPTVPDEPPDETLVAKLRYLADGEFCVVFEGEHCSLLGQRSQPVSKGEPQ